MFLMVTAHYSSQTPLLLMSCGTRSWPKKSSPSCGHLSHLLQPDQQPDQTNFSSILLRPLHCPLCLSSHFSFPPLMFPSLSCPKLSIKSCLPQNPAISQPSRKNELFLVMLSWTACLPPVGPLPCCASCCHAQSWEEVMLYSLSWIQTESMQILLPCATHNSLAWLLLLAKNTFPRSSVTCLSNSKWSMRYSADTWLCCPTSFPITQMLLFQTSPQSLDSQKITDTEYKICCCP